MPDSELQYWIAFNQLLVFGPKRFGRLLNYFKSLQEAWSAPFGQLLKAGLAGQIAEELIAKRHDISPKEELEKVRQGKLKVITVKDDNYPKLLREISNPPPLLYCRGGDFTEADLSSLAVVGTRKMTSYGKQVTHELVRGLVQAGLVVVSGLALGVDAEAHRVCLENGGRTIAVLGNGLDSIYPSSNAPLARKIEQNGLLVSEFPLGTPSFKSNFPHRNRVISGLTLGTLVIEAGESSGSLITGQLALEQNREVFAVPGPIQSPNSQGTHALIKQGAKLVASVADILEELNLATRAAQIKTREIIAASEEEDLIIKVLSGGPVAVDELVKKTKLDVHKINSILVTMELKGKVRDLGGMTYALNRYIYR